MFDATQFLIDHGHSPSYRSKSVTRGWVGLACVFCADTTDNAAINPRSYAYNCWKCGTHRLIDAISEIAGVSRTRARALIKQYETVYDASTSPQDQDRDMPQKKEGSPVQFPDRAQALGDRHRQYLRSRGLDPHVLEREYGVLGTDHLDPRYPMRIIVPIYQNQVLVSYQGRDITGNQIKYKACAKTEEKVPHKHCLYDLDNALGNDSVIVVEGVVDAWKLGHGAVATFGINYTTPQVLSLAKNFSRVIVLFDGEEQAQYQAHELCMTLQGLGIATESIVLDQGDAGDLDQEQARALAKNLLQ